MEAPQLRPLGIGDIVDRTFNLYRQRPLPLIALAAAPYLVLILAIGVLVLVFGRSLAGFAPVLDAVNRSPGAPLSPATIGGLADAVVAFISFAIVAVVIAIVLLSAQSAALVDASVSQYLGRTKTVGASFAAGVRAAPGVIGAGLLVFLAFVLLWTLLVVVFFISRDALVVGLGSIGGVILSVFLFASWVVAPCVVTIEGAGPILALRRSWALATGNRWRILGLQLLLVILQVVLSGLISFVFLAAFTVGDQVVRLVVQQLVNFASTILWVPVEWGATALLYTDLRVRREGFDLQLAAEALPRDA